MPDILRAILAPLNLPAERLRIEGTDHLPSAFPVTDLASSSIGAAALALSELLGMIGSAPTVIVDRRRASLWFGWSIQAQGWEMPPAWDPIAGDYRSSDGWIRLHTNAPHHRAAAIAVLGCPEDRAAVTAAVKTWTAETLEAAVVESGGCAAAMRTIETWNAHPNGSAVAAEPLVAFSDGEKSGASAWQPRHDRPLAGLKVLDLTRVLAGPVGTRFLAGYGADVLRVDPPGWDEANVIPEVTLGKRCTRLDLRQPTDRASFEHLLREADILVHGYRPGALDDLGYDAARRQALRPGLIDVSLDAYGWTGPWHGRRGFDSLVQMSTGIAAAGMAWKQADKPTPLPVQALDHATGYLIAAAVIRALISRLRGETATTARLSLTRTAALLIQAQQEASPPSWSDATDADYAPAVENTDWGPARRVLPPVAIAGAPMRWDYPASALGTADAEWPTP